jgi:hypothetical protein
MLYHKLKRRGYVRLVDEFWTSIMCSGYEEQMDGPS